MATRKSQRIGIWVIAGALTIGTLGGFMVMVLAPKNAASDQARYQQLMGEYQTESTAYQTKVDAQAAKLSEKYFAEFNAYGSKPAAFTAADVKELKKEDLKVGDGEAITKDSSFTAYYLGWNPAGKVFDGSIDGVKLKAPLAVTPGGVISGWTEGVDGMKVGGVRELTIPSDKAYGEAGGGSDDIPANTPLKFIVMIIPTPETIAQPTPSQELLKLHAQQQQPQQY
ncbi:MAG: FKBP-type peptidyl-prolyl cis-trans isomerase [Candidatus Saccharimonadales bacterium]